MAENSAKNQASRGQPTQGQNAGAAGQGGGQKGGPQKPEPARPVETEEWVFTVVKETGALMKIERVGAEGKREEMTLDQFGAEFMQRAADTGRQLYERQMAQLRQQMGWQPGQQAQPGQQGQPPEQGGQDPGSQQPAPGNPYGNPWQYYLPYFNPYFGY